MKICILLIALAASAQAAEPVPIGPGDKVFGTLATADAEVGLVFDALEGTVLDVKVKARTSGFEPAITLYDPSDTELRLAGADRHGDGSPKARIKRFVAPATGRYTLVVRSLSAVGGEFKLRFSAEHPRRIRDDGSIAFTGGFDSFRFPGFADTRMKFVLKGRNGFVPRVDGVLEPGANEAPLGDVVTSGLVVRNVSYACPSHGDYRLMVEGEGDARGEWKGKVKLVHPAHAPQAVDVASEPTGTFTADKLPPEDPPDQPPTGGGSDRPTVQNGFFRVWLGMIEPPPPPMPLDSGAPLQQSPVLSRFDSQVFVLTLENITTSPQSVTFVSSPWHNVAVRNTSTGGIVWIAIQGTLPVVPTVTFAPGEKRQWILSWSKVLSPVPPPGNYTAEGVFHTTDPKIPTGTRVSFTLR